MSKDGKILKAEDLAKRVMEVAILLAKGDPLLSANSKEKKRVRDLRSKTQKSDSAVS